MKLINLYHKKESVEAVIWIGNCQELKAPFDELAIVSFAGLAHLYDCELCPICGHSLSTHGYSKLLGSRICPRSFILKDSAGEYYIYPKETVFNYFGIGKENFDFLTREITEENE